MEMIKAMGVKSLFVSLIIILAMCLAISRAKAMNQESLAPAVNKYLVESMYGGECSFTVYQKTNPFATNDGANLSFGWTDNLYLPPVILEANKSCAEINIRLVPSPFQFRHIQKNNFTKRTEISSSSSKLAWDRDDFKQAKEEGYGSCYSLTHLDIACLLKNLLEKEND